VPRYYLDEHLSPVIAALCRERYGLDVLSTEAAGRKGRTDEEQLAFAASERRCIVTRDRDDFIELTFAFAASGRPHAGVLVVPASMPTDEFAQIAAAIDRYDREHPAGMPPYMLDYLRRGRDHA